MFCATCGAKVPDGAKFCPACGASFAQIPAAAPPSAAAPPPAPTPAAAPQPSTPAAPQRRRRTLPLALLAVAVVAVLGVSGFLAWRALSGGGATQDERIATNAVLANGTSTSAQGYDFYWDPDAGALMRARTDGSDAPMALAKQADEYGYLRNIHVLGDRVYFLTSSYSGDGADRLRCVSIDGTDEKTVFSAPATDDGDTGYIYCAYPVGDKIYTVVDLGSAEEGPSSCAVYRFGPEGEDQERLARIEGVPGGSFAMTPEAIYYASDGDLYALNYEEGAPSRIWRSQTGRATQPFVYYGRLWVWEGDLDYQSGTLLSMKPDGSDVREVMSPEAGAGMWPCGVYNGTLLLQARANKTSDDKCLIVGVSLNDGHEVMRLELEPGWGYPYVADGGDHMVVAMTAVDTMGAALGSYSVGPDGSVIATHKPYDN